MKKILIISFLLIAVLSLSAVSAQDNSTDIADISQPDDISDEILTDDYDIPPAEPVKKNLTATIHYVDEAAKYAELNDYYYLSIDGVNYDDNVEIYVDDEYIGTYENYGMGYELWPTRYSLGTHVITAKFNGNEKYNPFVINKTFEVVKVQISIPDEITPLNNGVNVRISEDATGTATVYANGTKIKTVTLKPGYDQLYGTYIPLDGLKFGTYEIKVVYSGSKDNKYPKTTKIKKVNVSFDMNSYFESSQYKEEGKGYVSLPKDAKNVPVVTIEGKSYEVKKSAEEWDDASTVYEIIFDDLNVGTHDVEVTYPGDGKYPSKTIHDKVNIYAKIKAENWVTVKEPNFIILNLPDDAEGNLTVYLDDELFANVRANTPVDLSNLSVGRYNFQSIYRGNDYDVDDEWTSLTVSPVFTYPEEMTYGDNETCYIDFCEDINCNITYTDEKTEGIVEIINGKGNFSLKNIKLERSNEYRTTIFVEYTPESGYGANFYVTVKINPIPSKLVGGKDITMYYGDSKTYSLTVWGDYGKIVGKGQSVVVKIGSKTYYAKTDENGVAKLNIDALPGKYTITATYHGAKVTNKLVVKQVLTLKTVTVKKSAKKLTLQATLKNAKAIKNKQITFKFNGKTYKAKTNSKGIAKVTVPKSVLKKLKVGKKVTYQATYLKDTVKKTVKVKK